MRIHEIGEFGLIDRLAGRLAAPDKSVVVGIGDDAAVLQYAEGAQVVTTTDMLAEGVHFRTDTIDDRSLGYKALAVSISDIAAMGGRPKHALVSLAIPTDFAVERLDDLYRGIDDVCREFATDVVGGDVVKTDGPFVLSVTLLGEVERGRALRRSGARPGDLVFVTGTAGGSAAGLDFLQKGQALGLAADDAVQLLRFHQRPEPQVAAGRLLLLSGACTSLNDISDGIASESNEIAKMSGVRLVLEGEKVPFHPAVSAYANLRGLDPLEWALFGGEDYQLIGSVEAEQFDRVRASFEQAGLQITAVGRVEAGDGVVLKSGGQERVLTPRGFNHFG